jgi:hypothetical protein
MRCKANRVDLSNLLVTTALVRIVYKSTSGLAMLLAILGSSPTRPSFRSLPKPRTNNKVHRSHLRTPSRRLSQARTLNYYQSPTSPPKYIAHPANIDRPIRLLQPDAAIDHISRKILNKIIYEYLDTLSARI